MSDVWTRAADGCCRRRAVKLVEVVIYPGLCLIGADSESRQVSAVEEVKGLANPMIKVSADIHIKTVC